MSWLNLIRLTSSTTHLKGRRKPWIGARSKRKGSLSLSLCSESQKGLLECTTLYWTCWSADGKMTTSRLKSEANIIDLWGFYAGMKTAQGVMRLRMNKVKVHEKYHFLPRLWCRHAALKSAAECDRSCDAMRVFPTSDSSILIPASYKTPCWAANTSNTE